MFGAEGSESLSGGILMRFSNPCMIGYHELSGFNGKIVGWCAAGKLPA
jgi:hypothetical protein